jgi:3-phosphoshikimate 1-carboxyvinyltransferase
LGVIRISPGKIPAERVAINLPASKSISNRALIIRDLSEGRVRLENLSDADDTKILRAALESQSAEVDLGEGGTTARFFLVRTALNSDNRILTGSQRLCERPIQPLTDALQKLGAKITFLRTPGFLPLKMEGGNLSGGEVELEASVSSQFISALMMIGPVLPEGLTIVLKGKQVSRPYVEMTAQLMRKCGASIEIHEKVVRIEPSGYADSVVKVEPDWSSASYFYACAAVNRNLKLFFPGLTLNSLQGDSRTAEIFAKLGVRTFEDDGGIFIDGSGKPTPPNHLDFLDCPDLAQTMASAFAAMGLPLKLTGLQTLRAKETDRIAAMQRVLTNLGVDSFSDSASLNLKPHESLNENVLVETFNDHRMAMSFAVLGQMIPIRIENPGVVAKSFPDFLQELEKTGARIQILGN